MSARRLSADCWSTFDVRRHPFVCIRQSVTGRVSRESDDWTGSHIGPIWPWRSTLTRLRSVLVVRHSTETGEQSRRFETRQLV
jgi:hypothetical protein